MSGPVPVRLQTSVWNPTGSRRALLLHGLGSDSSSWWRIASELADDDFLVLAPDLRSHGRSPTAVDHRLAAFAEDVLLLGEGYELVVGHSLGGSVAALLLARPGFATAAVLLDPVLRLEPADRARVQAAQRREVGQLEVDDVRRANPRWHERDVEHKVAAACLVTPGVVDAVFEHNDPWDVTGAADSWTARIEVLASDPDLGGMLGAGLLERVSTIDGVDGRALSGVGHGIHRERPDLVSLAIDEVLGS